MTKQRGSNLFDDKQGLELLPPQAGAREVLRAGPVGVEGGVGLSAF
jgi:hypothetical protein